MKIFIKVKTEYDDTINLIDIESILSLHTSSSHDLIKIQFNNKTYLNLCLGDDTSATKACIKQI